MPNVIIFRDFVNYIINSQSSQQDPNYPVSNIKIPEKQFRTWRTTGIGDSFVIFDFGSALFIRQVVLLNVNFATYRVQGNNSPTFTSPALNSGDISVSVDPFRFRYYSIYSNLASFNYRYMRILIPAQTPVDGASYFSVGGIVVTNDLSTTFITNPNWGFNITVKRASENVGLLSGASELTDLGERYVELNFDIEVDRYGGGLSYTSYYLQSIDQSTPIILAMNGAMTENPDNSMFVYCLKRISDPTYGLVAQSSADLKELSFRECI